MNINSEFKVQIVSTDEDDNEKIIAPALSAAIINFEREVNDSDEDADRDGSAHKDDFLVSGGTDGVEDEEEGDGVEHEGDDDGSDADEDPPEAQLFVTTKMSKEVAADLTALQDLNELVKIRFIFGDGVLVREFEVDSELWLSLNEAAHSSDDLQVTVCFDVYDSDIRF